LLFVVVIILFIVFVIARFGTGVDARQRWP
jgi:hypothetical protein